MTATANTKSGGKGKSKTATKTAKYAPSMVLVNKILKDAGIETDGKTVEEKVAALAKPVKAGKLDGYVCEECGGMFPDAATKHSDKCIHCGAGLGEVVGDESKKGKGKSKSKALSKYTREDLNTTTKEIISLKNEWGKATWEMAVAIKKAHDSEVWTVGGYDSFGAYASTELKMSRQSWYGYIAVAEKFKKDQFVKLGIGKARLLTSISDDKQRERLFKKVVDKGMTASDIRAEVKKARDASGAADGRRRSGRKPKGFSLNKLYKKELRVKREDDGTEFDLGGDVCVTVRVLKTQIVLDFHEAEVE